MISVLFVCLGNICRSPMAEAIFQHMVDKAGLSHVIQVDSAGIGDWHVGERAHHGTRGILKKYGIDYDGRARQIRSRDMKSFTYVLGMDRSNVSSIGRYMDNGATSEVNLFLHYANEAGLTTVNEVPDPYYTGNFDYVYDLVTKGSQALLDHIRAEHNL